MGQDKQGEPGLSRPGPEVDRAARVRAARAIAGLKQPELGHLLATSAQTIKRMESGEKAVSLDELRSIADACGVPRWFMESGFHPPVDEASSQTLEEVRDFGRKIERVDARLRHEAEEREAIMRELTARLDALEGEEAGRGPAPLAAVDPATPETARSAADAAKRAAATTRAAAQDARRRGEMPREGRAPSPPKRTSR